MINGINKDGFAYVLYINGAHQQWMILYPFKQNLIFSIIMQHLCMYFSNRIKKKYLITLDD